MFPVHTWLPDAHTEAPTAGSVILAGILLKMGGYGLLRIALPILSDAVRLFLTPMLVLSGVAIVYGAYVTLAQTDIKRLIAYSSISHMGFVTLGIFSLDQSGVEGAILQMINHGIITGALFCAWGMIYERLTRASRAVRRALQVAPIYSTFLAPLLSCSRRHARAEFLYKGVSDHSRSVQSLPWIGAMAVWASRWARLRAVAVLPNGHRELGLRAWTETRLNVREVATLAPLAVFAVVIGLYPESCSRPRASVTQLLAAVSASGGIAGRL